MGNLGNHDLQTSPDTRRNRKRPKNSKYFIAEIGVNHEGDINKAKLMIEQVKKANWHCVKFQTYKADTIAQVKSPSYWDISKERCTSQYELFQKHDKFDISDYKKLYEHCIKHHI